MIIITVFLVTYTYIDKPLKNLTLENWSLRVLIDCNNTLQQEL